MDAVVRIACCVCVRTGRGETPCQVHHMLSGGRRMGHLFTIGLCYLHHESGRNDEEVVSRDHNQRRFEARYGSERMLWQWTKQQIVERGWIAVELLPA